MSRSTPSLTHRLASLIRSLVRDKSARDQTASFVVEGPKSIKELIQARPDLIRFVVSTSDCLAIHTVTQANLSLYTCPPSMMERLTGTSTPQQQLAVVSKPQWDASTILAKPQLLMLYGEVMQDPANVGSLMRLAAAFEVDAVWFSPGSADPFNPKAVRASANAWHSVPVFSEIALEALEEARVTLYVADSDSTTHTVLPEVTGKQARTLLAFGSEGQGISPALLRAGPLRYRIPTSAAVESLNVSAAAAIALYHFHSLPLCPPASTSE